MKFSVFLVFICLFVGYTSTQEETPSGGDDECGAENRAQISKSFTNIFMLGDYNLTIPANDDDMKAKCRDLSLKTRGILRYIRNCAEGLSQSLMKIAVTSAASEYKLKCRSPSSRKLMLDALRCGAATNTVAEESRDNSENSTTPVAAAPRPADYNALFPIHRCTASFSILIVDRVRHLEPTQQIQALCCSRHLMSQCYLKTSRAQCEGKIPNTDWFYEHYTQMSGEIMNVLCGTNRFESIAQCNATVPLVTKEILKINEIYRDQAAHESNSQTRGETSLFQTLLNLFNELIETSA